MKFLIVFACALAAVSAGHVVAPLAAIYAGPQHLPIINHEGVPVDTAEVQYAKAAHLSQKLNVHARNGDLAIAHAAPIVAHAAPIVAAHAAPYVAHAAPYVAHAAPYLASPYVAAHGPAAYPTTAVLPTSINGVPLETPEVVAAKVNHFAAHSEALARTGYVHDAHHAALLRYRRGIFAAAPVAYTAAYSAPIVATSYAHHAPVVATSYAHTYAHPFAYNGHYY